MKQEAITVLGFCVLEIGIYQISPAASVIILGLALMIVGVANVTSPKKGEK